MNEPTLGILIIGGNEEKNIVPLFNCLAGADQILFNMTQFSDGTFYELSMLQSQFSLKILRNNWKDDFALARNQALRELTTDWVLWVDCDDRIQFPLFDLKKFLTGKKKRTPIIGLISIIRIMNFSRVVYSQI